MGAGEGGARWGRQRRCSHRRGASSAPRPQTYLLASSIPGDPSATFDFVLVQCSTYNTSGRALIAAKMMADVGRFDVPIAIGRDTGPQGMPQAGAADGYTLADFVAAGGTVLNGTARLQALMEAATPDDPLFVVESEGRHRRA